MRFALASLSASERRALEHVWPLWARADQLPPQGDWTTWVLLGGRGAGKTRAGAEWVQTAVRAGAARRVALVGETIHDAVDVMVDGPSGLLSIAPADFRPRLQRGERRLTWPNGAQAFLFSAKDPEGLRGPQFDLAWADELAKWARARDAWDMLQFGLRLGARPRQVVTTTPRPLKLLREILDDPGTVATSAPTYANRANLAPAFFDAVIRRYEGTRLGRQELDGRLLEDHPGALWSRAILDETRLPRPPQLDRVVVAVDPPVSSHEGSDECGLVVAGLARGEGEGLETGWHGFVLADRSARGLSPRQWAERAVAAYHEFRADRLIAEVNQGGDMVRAIVSQVDSRVAYRPVYARRGKITRAEPVAALYEQGRVHHVGCFEALEDQMCAFTLDALHGLGTRSPDRVDALVWALTELMLSAPQAEPRVRRV
ncbi:terminase family protein [Hyphomicrobiales bacterium FT118]|uniref:Terminase family protein n=1 Tax=Futiania mangrovi TaxID=2959716 RepID=A0A9J6PD43_9PROT|nr:terminase family protein [Futiania mangrovii]MCP1337293.1 terminase family protein [Futiania mangrovii]